MDKSKRLTTAKARVGGWLPQDRRQIRVWIQKLKQSIAERPREMAEPVLELQQMVYSDPVLHGNVAMMFADAYRREKQTPLGEPEVRTFEEFLTLLNAILTTAPECYQTHADQPAGLIGFPINALLDWPMGTTYGYDVFSNSLVNQQFKNILASWSQFLVTPASRYVLVQPDPSDNAIAWLSDQGQAEMVSVATSAVGEGTTFSGTFSQIFNSNPNDKYYGFQSWDDFFTRTFAEGVRPISSPGDDGVVINSCESAPYALQSNVALSAPFWVKGQPYSLAQMLNWDKLAPDFAGGTVYQAFLSALSYHRWQAPVSGTVRKAYIINGSYYLENLYQGFESPNGADPSAPNDSQPFITAVATRALVFIEADNPAVGLMGVLFVGMAEVSSCEITVKPGQRVQKGQELGMFHFGGSTHCLIFRPGVNLSFNLYGQTPGPNAETNIRVNTAIATVT